MREVTIKTSQAGLELLNEIICNQIKSIFVRAQGNADLVTKEMELEFRRLVAIQDYVQEAVNAGRKGKRAKRKAD